MLLTACRIFSDWDEYVSYKTERWEELYSTWISEGRRVALVQYEDILDAKRQPAVIESILNFLNYSKKDPDRLECLSSNPEGKFHRNKNSTKKLCNAETSDNYMHDIFTPVQKQLIDSAVDRLDELVRKHWPDQVIDFGQYKSTVVDFC